MAITILPWSHESELAFVRDCFYPVKNPNPSTVNVDVYAYVPPAPPSNPNQPLGLDNPAKQTVSNYTKGLDRVKVWTFRSIRTVPRAVTATASLIDAKLHDEQLYREHSIRGNTKARPDGNINFIDYDDPSGEDRTSFFLSENSMQSIYSTAISRFVNSFVDRDVARNTFATGLSNLAQSSAFMSSSSSSEDEDEDDQQHSTQVKSFGESSMYAHAQTIGMPLRFVDMRHRCVHSSELPPLEELRLVTDQALTWLWERWWKENAKGDSARYLWERGQRG